ncbi:putative UHRF1-binding protein [Helianthus annuus]|nr:putative UHRF1-binding protein [Helianthus annuus]
MESILARALEYTLKYWLKSFTRDQFKLQGRTVQLSNLDINGDALHASLGLPPALNVTTAKVGKLEIILPYFSNVQVEPIVVQIDKLDLVLEENDDLDAYGSADSAQTPSSPAKGSGYGFADKIADGMTLEVRTVNLLLETHGGARRRGGATWASPMASITIRNLLLYTTNENWQVVNLKEARDFSNDKKFIYVFKKLEWEHLSIDLLPHPDMFAAFSEGAFKDDDGAKRVFFGGERFLEGISGEAYITIQRTELNSPLGLELQLHITEAVCPALSEPGLRALLRFFTGLYVCLNRGDVNPHAQERSAEAAGRTLVSIMVDHIFFCIKDTDFRLELLMQSLFFSRASLSDGEITRCLTRVMIGGLFLRDTFSSPPCALVQPSMQDAAEEPLHVPDFGKNFCPPIYPLGDQQWRLNDHAPLISLHSLQFIPAPTPPSFSSQTVIDCQPLMIHLQEESCLRISFTHRTLGGAMAISSTLRWDRVQVDCTETEENSINANGVMPNDYHKLRAVFWVQNGRDFPFLDLRMVHVIPYNARDTECHSLSVSACIAGVRLAGGMNYAEALLHRFGILGPDGGPGVGLSKGLEHLSSGPFSKLFKASPLLESKSEKMEEEKHSGYLQLGPPDDVDVSLELRDWLFALEGAEVAEKWRFDNSEDSYRQERCWHTTFDSFQVKANSSKKHSVNSKKISPGALKYPVESVTVGVEGLKTLKPQKQKGNALPNGHTQAVESHGGVDLEADIVLNEDDGANGAIKWVVESLKFSVKHPVEAIVTKDELQHVAQLCKSEVDSMGRITAGVLRVLKLEGSVGQTAMDQLSNLGSEGFDNIFSHRYSNGSSVGLIPSSLLASDNRHASSPDPTLSSLEAALLDSKSNCAALAAELSRTESSKQHLDSVEQLAQKLESMQKLLSELQSRV